MRELSEVVYYKTVKIKDELHGVCRVFNTEEEQGFEVEEVGSKEACQEKVKLINNEQLKTNNHE